MRIGNIISVDQGVKRDVAVRISAEELCSEISDPPGPIRSADVTAYRIIEQQSGYRRLLHLDFVTTGGSRIRFYTAATQFDIALLLDELEASLGGKPTTWLLRGNLKALLKCIHPLLPLSVGAFALFYFGLPVRIEDLLPIGRSGPCTAGVFFLFVPTAFGALLGLGFTAIRVFELRHERRKLKTGTP